MNKSEKYSIVYNDEIGVFFITNQRSEYCIYDKKFASEADAVSYICKNVNLFINIHNKLKKTNDSYICLGYGAEKIYIIDVNSDYEKILKDYMKYAITSNQNIGANLLDNLCSV